MNNSKNKKLKKSTLLLMLLLSAIFIQAQEDAWKEYTSADDKIFLQYKSKKLKDKHGKSKIVAEYIATTETDLSLATAKSFLLNSANYKLFWENNEISKEVKRINSKEWLTYLYVDAPWPVANFDIVHHLSYRETANGFVINGYADPDAYERKDMKRMQVFDVKFEFTELASGKTKFVLSAKFSPTVTPPKWLFNTWFPKGPCGIVQKLVSNASARE